MAEKLTQDIRRIFLNEGLRITVEPSSKSANFLDVSLNLQEKTFHPFTKPNANINYMSSKSNHPPVVVKNLTHGMVHKKCLTNTKTVNKLP